MKTLGVALLGLGRAGGFHLQSLRQLEGGCVRVVFDLNHDKARSIAEKHQCDVAPTLHDAVNRDDVQAVIVATPTDAHEEGVLAAIEAGKAVLTEKPLGTTLSQIDGCFQRANQKKLPLFVAFQRRFDPSFSELVDQVHDGQLGQLQFLRSVSRDNPVPTIEYLRISGGIYHDCVVHDLDMICHLTQEPPSSIAAFGSSFLPDIQELGDHDNVVAAMEFPSGTVASIDVSRRCAFGYDQRLEVFGELGMLIADNQHQSTVTQASEQGFRRSPVEYSFPSRYRDAYLTEMACFLSCVRGDRDVPITQHDVRLNHILATGLEMAARERTVIYVNEIEAA